MKANKLQSYISLNKIWKKLTSLTERIESFEETKSDIVGSALGSALGLSTEDKWEDVVSGLVGAAENLGTATEDKVLSGYTFSSSEGLNKSGTIVDRGTLDWSPLVSSSFVVEPGYYSGGVLNCAAVYEQGKKDALKTGGGIYLYPMNDTTNASSGGWTTSLTVSATGASKAGQTRTTSALTQNKINLASTDFIQAIISGSAHPTSNGTGNKNSLGSASASMFLSEDGSTSIKSGSVSWRANSATQTIVLDTTELNSSYFIHLTLSAYGGFITNTASKYWYSTSTVTVSSIAAGAN